MDTNRLNPSAEDYLNLLHSRTALATGRWWEKQGKVIQLVGNLIVVDGLEAALGDVCQIAAQDTDDPIYAEVVGFDSKRLKLSPLTPVAGIRPGSLARPYHLARSLSASPELLGRVLDGMGLPIDGKGPLPNGTPYPLSGKIANPLSRPMIREQLDVGVRSINGLLPIGKGQRMGIFAGSGVGKSTLLGMMARHTTAPVNVIALIGERGREVNEFIENELGPEGMEHSVVVVATSNQPATVRMRGAYVACTIAEYFCDQGRDVLLMMDSVTRFAMAGREIGLAAGEPPTTKGYTPSVFARIPQILERSGSFEKASITGIFTVLVEGDDFDDPIADALRAILDGHIVLDRGLAHKRHYPAIDILKSVSRLTDQLLGAEERMLISRFVQILTRYKSSEDMINIGAYSPGTSHDIDYAVSMIDKLDEYLRQPVEGACSIEESEEALEAIFHQP